MLFTKCSQNICLYHINTHVPFHYSSCVSLSSVINILLNVDRHDCRVMSCYKSTVNTLRVNTFAKAIRQLLILLILNKYYYLNAV